MSLWDELLPMTKQLHGKVLDAGCGKGVYSQRLAAEISAITEVVSLDRRMDWDFRANCPVGRFARGDIQDMRMFRDGEFDCSAAWHILEHLDRPDKALSELVRVTKDTVFIAMPIGSLWGTDNLPGGHRIAWEPEDLLCKAAKAGLMPVGEVFIDSTHSMNCLFRKGVADGNKST